MDIAPTNRMAQQIDPEDFICDVCGREFGTVSELEDHKESGHLRHAHERDEEQQRIRRDIGAAGLPGSPLP
jgi:hypothetical protein